MYVYKNVIYIGFGTNLGFRYPLGLLKVTIPVDKVGGGLLYQCLI